MLSLKESQKVINEMVAKRLNDFDNGLLVEDDEVRELQALQMAGLLFKHVVVVDEVLMKEA